MPAFSRIIRSPQAIGLLVAIASLVVYLRTLAPSVDFIDAGELSTVAWTLGIAHPTGYPLWTLIAWCFVHLPFPIEPVVRLNLLAALFSAAGIYAFFQVMVLILRETFRPEAAEAVPSVHAAASGAALLLAFSRTYWSQAVAVEVYSLHVLFLSLVLYTFLNANRIPQDYTRGDRSRSSRWWFLFAYTLGLSFANHMTTILLGPGLLVFYFLRQGLNAQSWRRLGLLALPFVAGLSLYLYLPVRGLELPVMNWGEPTNLERFLLHVSGQQFRPWMFSSAGVAGTQLLHFLRSLPEEQAYTGLLLAIAGAALLFRRSWRLGVLTALLVVGCIGYAINYKIHDIDSYFLLAYITVALWAGCAIFAAGAWLRRNAGFQPGVVLLLTLLVGFVPLAYHFRTLDESNNHLVEDYTRNMFASLEPHAIVLSYQWDYWVSAAYYVQLVQNARTDVVVIDTELLRRSWYIAQLERRYPWLIERSREAVSAYLAELFKFEHGPPYGGTLQASFLKLVRSLISRNITDRPVYITPEIDDSFTIGFQRVPEGLAFRLFADTLFHPCNFPTFRYRPFDRRGRLEDDIRAIYADAFVFRGQYYLNWGYGAEAEEAFRTALSFDPARPSALEWLKFVRSRPR